MMKLSVKKIRLFLLSTVVVAIASGCVGKTEYPTDVPSPDDPRKPQDTTYIVVNPIWTEANGLEFSHPRGVAFGYDRSVYICDTDNDRIVRMSVTGEFIEQYPVPHPVQITQDRQLNLLCVNGENVVYRRPHFGGGEFDTALIRDSLGVLVEVQYPSGDSVITDTILMRYPTGFLGIAASPLIDRHYLVLDSTRDVISILDVDDHGLAGDIFRDFARPPAKNPVGIMTYLTGENSYNIVFTQMSRYAGLRIVNIPSFIDVVLDNSDIYNMLPAGHKQVTRDDLGNFLIVSTPANEIYRFTRNGAYTFKFGGPGLAPGQLNGPHGICWGEGTLYVADSYNNRIVRYQLSTDLQF